MLRQYYVVTYFFHSLLACFTINASVRYFNSIVNGHTMLAYGNIPLATLALVQQRPRTATDTSRRQQFRCKCAQGYALRNKI